MDPCVIRVRGCVVQVHGSIKETLEVACSLLVLHAVFYIYLWQTENMTVFI